MNKNNCYKSNQIKYYCSNYRTTNGSNQFTTKGNIKKISIYNARIVYLKEEDKYYFFIKKLKKSNNILLN